MMDFRTETLIDLELALENLEDSCLDTVEVSQAVDHIRAAIAALNGRFIRSAR